MKRFLKFFQNYVFILTRSNSSFITTPIFYVNGAPHLGHAHSAILADALHRRHLLKYPDSSAIFTTGTDEHGTKVQQSAFVASQTPLQFCDTVSAGFRRLFDSMNVGYTDFIRTTEERHALAVASFWQKLVDGGHLQKGTYSGWYSVVDEAYLPRNALVKQAPDDPEKTICAESGNYVQWNEETNYIFKLGRFKDDLGKWLESEEVIQPKSYLPTVLSTLDGISDDLSVSRSRTRLAWGVPVPGDDTQTIYVWLDALVNYLTVAGYPHSNGIWRNVDHVIGKDILKFHAIFWPAFLMAAKMELPRRILVHSHWLVDHRKMSKSLGNVVNPASIIDVVSVDGLRYFLLAEATPHDDANFSHKKLIDKVNAELCNTLANLFSRVTAAKLNPNQTFPIPTSAAFLDYVDTDSQLQSLFASVVKLPEVVDEGFVSLRLDKSLDAIMDTLRLANGFLQHARPWKMDRHNEREKIAVVIFSVLETLRVCGTLMQPVVPGLASNILDIIQGSNKDRSWRALWSFSRPFSNVLSNVRNDFQEIPLNKDQDSAPLFKRIS